MSSKTWIQIRIRVSHPEPDLDPEKASQRRQQFLQLSENGRSFKKKRGSK
jgi:hypothetical protein